MTTKKRAPRRQAPRQEKSPPPSSTNSNGIGPVTIKWAVGALAALFALYAGWKVVWDDIKTYWRLEQVQVVKDKETESKLHSLAQKAEVGRAWLFFSISDFKADWREQKADDCHEQKPKQGCAKLDSAATQARAESLDAKRSALEAGKDK